MTLNCSSIGVRIRLHWSASSALAPDRLRRAGESSFVAELMADRPEQSGHGRAHRLPGQAADGRPFARRLGDRARAGGRTSRRRSLRSSSLARPPHSDARGCPGDVCGLSSCPRAARLLSDGSVMPRLLSPPRGRRFKPAHELVRIVMAQAPGLTHVTCAWPGSSCCLVPESWRSSPGGSVTPVRCMRRLSQRHSTSSSSFRQSG